MQLDLLSLGSNLEISYPNLQCLHNVEATEFQLHFSILYLSEIEDAAYQLLQRLGIALHHLQEFSALSLDTTILQEHFHRVGDKSQWGTKFMTDVRKEHQSRMGQLHHFLVQSFQLLILLRKFLIKSSLYHVSSEDSHNCDDTNQKEAEQADEDVFLRVIIGKIAVYLLVKHIQVLGLSLRILRLQQGEFGIRLGNDRSTQVVISLIRLMFQDFHCQGYHLVTLGWVKVSCLEDAISHQFQATALSSHGIHTCVFIRMLHAHLPCCHVCAPSQTVVVGKDIIEVFCLLENALHRLYAALLLPVAAL